MNTNNSTSNTDAPELSYMNQIMANLHLEDHPLWTPITERILCLVNHPAFHGFDNLAEVQIFMKYQVWCVWDFMSLAKSIQHSITGTSLPWLPAKDANLAAYINEVVLSEESDQTPSGQHASHFELFLAAMERAGVSTEAPKRFIEEMRGGVPFDKAIGASDAPEVSKMFVKNTIGLALSDLHMCTAAFCFSREGIIPDMYTTLLNDLIHCEELDDFRWFINRHIELDSESHGPLSIRLFNSVVGDDPQKLEEALEAAIRALDARIALLDAINEERTQYREHLELEAVAS